MPKKAENRIGSFLGSPEAFASQFFFNLVNEYELTGLFADVINSSQLVKYACQSCAINAGGGYQMALHTPVGIIVGDSSGGGTYALLDYWFTRTVENAGSFGSVRYDTCYVENAVMATWAAFLSFLRSGGVSARMIDDATVSGRGTVRLPGTGPIYNIPVIPVPYFSGQLTYPMGLMELRIREQLRPYLLELMPKVKQTPLQEQAKKMFTRSQEMWPEMKGLWTRFVDNIGVYLPNYLDLDLNLTYDLGSEYVGTYLVRIPSSAGEASFYKMNFMFDLANQIMGMAAGGAGAFSGAGSSGNGMMPIGSDQYGTMYAPTGSPGFQGGAAAAQAIRLGQGIGNLLLGLGRRGSENIRFVFPRVRGFGRQYTADVYGTVSTIPTWAQAKSLCDSRFQYWQDIQAGGLTGSLYRYYQKIIVLMPQSEWDKFVDDMNRIVSSSVSATGGLQGFPY